MQALESPDVGSIIPRVSLAVVGSLNLNRAGALLPLDPEAGAVAGQRPSYVGSALETENGEKRLANRFNISLRALGE